MKLNKAVGSSGLSWQYWSSSWSVGSKSEKCSAVWWEGAWLLTKGLGKGCEMRTRPPWPKMGDREKHPGVSHKLWLTPRLHSPEVVKLCLDVVMQPPPSLPPWEQGKNYSSHKAFATTADDESTRLPRSWDAPGSPEAQLGAAEELRALLGPLGLQDCPAGSDTLSHQLPCLREAWRGRS